MVTDAPDANFAACAEFYLYQYNFDVTINVAAGDGGSAEITEGDAIILECPHCHEFVSLQFDSLNRLIIPKESA